jgi:hypothetical protein
MRNNLDTTNIATAKKLAALNPAYLEFSRWEEMKLWFSNPWQLLSLLRRVRRLKKAMR